MKDCIVTLSDNYKNQPSTNFVYYLNLFEGTNTDWIDEINELIEKED